MDYALTPTPRSLALEDWIDLAACRGKNGEAFFPPTAGESRAQRQLRENSAKAICGSCNVRLHCLQHALTTDERFGIWGGLNDLERRALRRSA